MFQRRNGYIDSLLSKVSSYTVFILKFLIGSIYILIASIIKYLFCEDKKKIKRYNIILILFIAQQAEEVCKLKSMLVVLNFLVIDRAVLRHRAVAKMTYPLV
jgi:hypothetical protein